MTTSHRPVGSWTANATRLPSMPIAADPPVRLDLAIRERQLTLDGRERHELQRHAGSARGAAALRESPVLVDDAVTADDRSVACARDPEHRDAAVRDPQCIERVPLGCRQDGDLAEEDDARRPIDQRPRRDPVACSSRDYIEPVGPVDAVGREHDSHEAVALRRDQVLWRRGGTARLRSPTGDRRGRVVLAA